MIEGLFMHHRFSPTRRPRLALAGGVALILALLGGSVAVAAEAQLAPKRCEIIGTPGPDVLDGTDGDDVICGLGGDDVIRGFGGDDELLGGDGDDALFGGPGDDRLRGDAGSDRAFGGPGDDILRGGNEDDLIVGGPGNDELRGGNDDDTMSGGSGDDVLRGGNDDDTLRGSSGSDVLWGGAGRDILKGGAGNDRLRGGPDGDICQDSFAKTNSINCEFGNGGNADKLAIAEQLWQIGGNREFVYALAITKPCPTLEDCGVSSFAETVHVRNGIARSSFGAPAFTAEQLFREAELSAANGRKVQTHPVLGLPTLVDNPNGATLGVSEIQLRDSLRSDYEAAIQRWNDAGLSDYAFTVSTSCFCPFTVPIRVVVSNANDVSGEPLGEGAPEWTGGVKTIEAHFSDLGAVLDGTAIEVLASFDPELGFPTSISVDESRLIADEERTVTISDFGGRPIPEGEIAQEPPASQIPKADPPTPVDEPSTPDGEGEAPAAPNELDIVSVGAINVSVAIADDVRDLLAAAAVDGLTLSGGGFRDPQRQIELRKVNCGTSDYAIYEMPADQCSPPTARPGQSQHELGLAIDFTSSGRLITSSADPAFMWLAEHANAYGFINLAAEPWHWSTTGN
ncbi:MAG: Ca2+-binding RTX toxin-like protein [Verrucomicrobiales bacterium]